MRTTLTLLALHLTWSSAGAQSYGVVGYQQPKPSAELALFGGVLIPDNDLGVVDDQGHELRLDTAPLAGVRLTFNFSEHASFEATFGYAPSSLVVDRDFFGIGSNAATIADVDVFLYQGAFSYDFLEEQVRPFVTVGFGALQFDPKVAGVGSEAEFVVSVGGGVKVYANRNLGFRLDLRDHIIPGDIDYDYGYAPCCGQPARDHVELSAGLILGF
jgi:outer membrane beta-barrel protein